MTTRNMVTEGQTLLAQGNLAFRGQDYEQALYCYERALAQAPDALRSSLSFNRNFAERRLRDRHGDAAQAMLDRIQARLKLEQEISAVRPFFDAEFYLERNPDVAGAGIDPVEHYCGTGWREGRDPHPEFCTRYYLDTYPDVGAAAINPYWHFLVAGKAEGRQARADITDSPPVDTVSAPAKLEKPDGLEDYFFDQIRQSGLFDPAWYISQYGAKYNVRGNPLGRGRVVAPRVTSDDRGIDGEGRPTERSIQLSVRGLIDGAAAAAH